MLKKTITIIATFLISIILLSNNFIDYDETLFLLNNYKTNDNIKISLNKEISPIYTTGEKIEIYYETTNASPLIIFDVLSSGKVQIIYPHKYVGFPLSEKNKLTKIPDSNNSLFYDLVIGDSSGKEYILALSLNEYPKYIIDRINNLEFLPILDDTIEEVLEALSENMERGFSYDYKYFFSNITSNRGTLEVNSFPENSNIYLNNKLLGTTPIFTGLDIGYYLLETEYASESIKEKILIEPGKKTSVYHQFNIYQKGKIYFRGDNNSEIRLFMNNEFIGYIPTSIEELPGEYSFLFINDKDKKNSVNISIEENKIKYIRINENLEVEK